MRLCDQTVSPAAEALSKLIADALRLDVAAGAALAAGNDPTPGR